MSLIKKEKNNGQREHNLASLSIESPDLCTYTQEQLLTSLKKDKRSAGQIFESLRQELINFSDGKLDDEEATNAARRLIGVFEVALEVAPENRSFQLDDNKNGR